MKNPTIEVVFSSNKKIAILYDFGDRKIIPNKTTAKKFEFTLKRLIRNNIIILSDLQSKVYSSYRSNYLYLSDKTSRQILKNINHFDNEINFVFKRYSEGNGSFVFHALENLFISIENSAELLKGFGRKHNSIALKNDMNATLLRLECLSKDFDIQKRNLELLLKPKRKMKIVKFNRVGNGEF
jgi:hypothetical protein